LGGKKPFAILAIEDTHEEEHAVAVLTGIHDGEQALSGLSSRPQISVDPKADVATALETLLQGLLKEAGKSKLLTVYSWPTLDSRPLWREDSAQAIAG